MATDTPSTSALLAYLNEATPVLFLKLNARQQVESTNAYARRVLGEHLVGRTLGELIVDFTPPPDWMANHDAIHLLSLNTAAGIPDSYYFRFFEVADGWWALGSLDHEEQTRLQTQVMELNHELNALTRQLHLANAELQELNQLKNQFLGMAAHDLRKPIGIVMTYTEFVLDEAGEALATEHEGFLRTCLNAAIGMRRLIDDFLDISMIESGRLRLDREWTTVHRVLDPALEIGRLIASRKNIRILTDLSDQEMSLHVDAPKLQQVMVNLIGNAVEHSQSGRRIWVSSRHDDREIVCAVRDEGPGIPLDDQTQMFQPYARAEMRKTAGERSTGLGLAIARKVTEAHQGRIWVESTPGNGASFFVALPVEISSHETSDEVS